MAAAKAKEIFTFLEANNWDATLAKFKPKPVEKLEVATLGEFIAAINESGYFQPRTARIYATKFRKLMSDLSDAEAGMKTKQRRSKYDYVNGGRAAWLAKLGAQSLDVLTPESINEWRNAYVAKADADPVKRKAAERSAASILRAGRALFAAELVSLLKLSLPANPFANVKVRDPGPQRYHSTVNPEWLLTCAETELRTKHPQQYLALFLCLWAGLRRKEADLLTWKQIDFKEAQIHVRRTIYFEPKTEESQRTIDLPQGAVQVLRSFMKGSEGEFVLNGGEAKPSASYGYYRCDGTWSDLIGWLKSKGIQQRNAIHTLRKESGSLIASDYGIEAARQHLGHRDIRTTSAHYVDKKKRLEIKLTVSPVLEVVGNGTEE